MGFASSTKAGDTIGYHNGLTPADVKALLAQLAAIEARISEMVKVLKDAVL